VDGLFEEGAAGGREIPEMLGDGEVGFVSTGDAIRMIGRRAEAPERVGEMALQQGAGLGWRQGVAGLLGPVLLSPSACATRSRWPRRAACASTSARKVEVALRSSGA